jgi:hypothetical protein
VACLGGRAEAIPVQIHLFVDLETEPFSQDLIGLNGATLEIVYDLYGNPPGSTDVTDGVTSTIYTGAQGNGAHILISGSAGNDGQHTAFPFWAILNSSATSTSLAIADLTANVNGWNLTFGALGAIFPPGFADLSATGGVLPFEFTADQATGWIASAAGLNTTGPIDPATGLAMRSDFRYTNVRGYAAAVGVPEPSTLLLTGLGALLAVRRRRALTEAFRPS